LKFKEVETKYSAENISLQDFVAFCEKHDEAYLSKIEAAGFDHFYYSAKDPKAFYRHRIGPDLNQLTFKRKIQSDRNYIRTEHNINLEPTTPKEKVAALVSESGFEHNVTIFKSCFVYYFERVVLSYYVCYDSNMKEIGRFFEIEANEDYGWKTEQDAWGAVTVMEIVCRPLGVTPQMRIKRSLFELFRKQ
jgi:adenylate cyclase class IV